MATFRVATRKGLLVYEQKNGWQITGSSFIGDPVTMIMTDPASGEHYAALNLGHFGTKLHRAAAGTLDWQEVGVPKYPKPEEGEGASLKQIWELASSEGGVLWAGTIPGGLFRSQDRGESWELMSTLWERPEREHWFGGGYDHPGIHSICPDPRNSARLLLAISCGGVWETLDSGASWNLLGKGLRAEYMPPDQSHSPVSQDPHRMVMCPQNPDSLWIQHHNGIFHSSDSGHNWQEITEAGPSTFGFATVVHPNQPETAWFVPGIKDQYRVPVDAALAVTRTRDGGKTFDVLRNGLPQNHCYDVVYRHAMAIDDSGDVLVMGSTTGNLWITEDQGDSWQHLSATLPPIYAIRFDP